MVKKSKIFKKNILSDPFLINIFMPRSMGTADPCHSSLQAICDVLDPDHCAHSCSLTHILIKVLRTEGLNMKSSCQYLANKYIYASSTVVQSGNSMDQMILHNTEH